MYHGVARAALPQEAAERRVYVEMEAGDTVFFHPHLIHGSGMNKTAGFRKAISCHYAAADAPFDDVQGEVRETMMAEVLGLLAKKVGVSDATLAGLRWEQRMKLYHDVWRVKSRPIDDAAKEEPSWDRQVAFEAITKFAMAGSGAEAFQLKARGRKATADEEKPLLAEAEGLLIKTMG